MKTENNYYVYCHVTPDNMYYIGMSQQSTKLRWRSYGYKGTSLYPYIEKYGWGNIKHRVVQDGLDRKEAQRIEDMLIEQCREWGCCINKHGSGGLIEGDNQTAYYNAHKEEIAEYMKSYNYAHKEEKAEYNKTYYNTNKEKIAAQAKAYCVVHREEKAEYMKTYCETHKEEIAARKKAYYEAHKEEIAAKGKAYRETHKEEIKAYREAHRKRVVNSQRNNKKSKPVLQLDLDGNLVKEWPSTREIQRQTSWSCGNISKACQGKCKTSHGYRWQYKDC